MMEVAKHLVTTESNYSSLGLDGFPEVVIMYPVGKRLITYLTLVITLYGRCMSVQKFLYL